MGKPAVTTIVVAGHGLFLTHCGGLSDKVTISTGGSRALLPEYFAEVMAGLNPFGLGFTP